MFNVVNRFIKWTFNLFCCRLCSHAFWRACHNVDMKKQERVHWFKKLSKGEVIYYHYQKFSILSSRYQIAESQELMKAEVWWAVLRCSRIERCKWNNSFVTVIMTTSLFPVVEVSWKVVEKYAEWKRAVCPQSNGRWFASLCRPFTNCVSCKAKAIWCWIVLVAF